MTATVLPIQVIKAPDTWRTVDFISDLHLQEKDPATFRAWQSYMQNTTADAVFVLGDLFEVWVGDDAAGHHSFMQQCAQVLRDCAAKRYVGFMRGNRDFLVGAHFLNQCHVHDLQDPAVLIFASHKALLSHGDEGCLEDTDYQNFRKMVRQLEWQESFLAKPLAEREAIARQLRDQSEQHKQDPHRTYADVDNDWSVARLEKTGATCLIHGHTHQPANHTLGQQGQYQRYVLSDWDCHTSQPRAEVLRWHASGLKERSNPLTV